MQQTSKELTDVLSKRKGVRSFRIKPLNNSSDNRPKRNNTFRAGCYSNQSRLEPLVPITVLDVRSVVTTMRASRKQPLIDICCTVIRISAVTVKTDV